MTEIKVKKENWVHPDGRTIMLSYVEVPGCIGDYLRGALDLHVAGFKREEEKKEPEESELKKLLKDGYERGCWVNLDQLGRDIMLLAEKKVCAHLANYSDRLSAIKGIGEM